MKRLISDIRKIGFLHALNHAFLRISLRHAGEDEAKCEAVCAAFVQNEKQINDLYSRFLKYF